VVILLGISSPSHKGQLFLQPAPESVLVTKAPPRRMNIIPMVETTSSHLTVLNISLASLLFLKLCQPYYDSFYVLYSIKINSSCNDKSFLNNKSIKYN